MAWQVRGGIWCPWETNKYHIILLSYATAIVPTPRDGGKVGDLTLSVPPRGGAIAGNVCQIPIYPPPLPQVGEMGQTIDRCITWSAVFTFDLIHMEEQTIYACAQGQGEGLVCNTHGHLARVGLKVWPLTLNLANGGRYQIELFWSSRTLKMLSEE